MSFRVATLSHFFLDNGNEHREQRQADDAKNDRLEVFAHNCEVAKEITQKREAEYPTHTANYIESQKDAVAHIR